MYFLDIGFPRVICLVVGMAHQQAEMLAFAADFTFSHLTYLLVLRLNRIKSRTRWVLRLKLHSEKHFITDNGVLQGFAWLVLPGWLAGCCIGTTISVI
jgi:hypothetical protein